MTEAAGEKNNHGLTEIAVRPPANLAELIGYPGAARYVAFYYVGTNATWDDGLASAGFSYYGVYAPLTQHPVMAIHLLDADLGSDDTEPTHALVCDREGGRFLLGRYNEALRLVNSQFDEEARRAAGERYNSLFAEPTTPEEFRARGMFEIFVAPSAAAQLDTAGLLHHLDSQITEELVRRYVELSKGANAWHAFGPLRYIQNLIKRAKEAAGEHETAA